MCLWCFPISLSLHLPQQVTVIFQYEYKRTFYYNSITGDSNHLEFIYYSDFLTILLLKPVSRKTHISIMLLHGVCNTVGPEICNLIKAWKIDWSSINPAHFFTHRLPGEKGKESLGPIIIKVNVIPGSTSSDTTHEVFQEILLFL
ncbi:hypothetical protein F4604DRAFT_1579412 [Suillus subluteus]|nr:hypothetical protein F4604DRAFT_1579412 [Suillus subluteus]